MLGVDARDSDGDEVELIRRRDGDELAVGCGRSTTVAGSFGSDTYASLGDDGLGSVVTGLRQRSSAPIRA